MAVTPRFAASAAAADDLVEAAAGARQEPIVPVGQAAAGAAEREQIVAEFSEFYRAEFRGLMAFLIMQGLDSSGAADVVQEAMVGAFRNWKAIEHPRAWVRTVAVRLWRRQATTNHVQPVAQVPEPHQSEDSHQVEAEAGQRHDLVRLLGRLPARQREVIALNFDGYNPTEIAEMLQLDVATVRSNLRHARQRLQQALREQESSGQ
ncbi:RNA polymerase sigma factor [Micromonospora chersina]|uniref:RNA polymerase sigma factor n=1 Tax=Micromonospora chersina TaxID=47854 RepID=UPI003722EE57